MSMWGGGFDPDLGSKIDQILAGKPSAKQRVEEFLVDELHVDPTKIPLSFKDARVLINQKMGERDSVLAHFKGSSMGLGSVVFDKSQADEPSTCPNCGYTGYLDDLGGGQWECDDCSQLFAWSPSASSTETLTERSDKLLWNDLLRVYAALLKGVRPEDDGSDAPDCDECGTSNTGSREAPHLCEGCEKKLKPKRPPAFTKFDAHHSWAEATVQGVLDTKPRWKRPEKYPTGTRLRINNGTESVYVRIGGLFSDTEVVNLENMKPISSPAKWTVVEVIDD